MSTVHALRQLWPEERLPRVRRAVLPAAKRLHGLITRELPFAFWRITSQHRFGATRRVHLADGDLVVRSDDYRGYRIAQQGGTQPEKIRAWRKVVELAPDIAVDVGANYGEFTLAAASVHRCPVVAIEANPLLVECLRSTFEGRDDVEVIHAAAAAEEGIGELWTQSRSSGSGSLGRGGPDRERRDVAARGMLMSTRVRTARLDSLLATAVDGRPPRSVALKVDVEGYESEVLTGLGSLFEDVEWWRALIEFGPGTIVAAGKDPREVWARLRQHAGVIVSIAGVRDQSSVEWSSDAVLPAEPPGEVDVLVGRGDPS